MPRSRGSDRDAGEPIEIHRGRQCGAAMRRKGRAIHRGPATVRAAVRRDAVTVGEEWAAVVRAGVIEPRRTSIDVGEVRQLDPAAELVPVQGSGGTGTEHDPSAPVLRQRGVRLDRRLQRGPRRGVVRRAVVDEAPLVAVVGRARRDVRGLGLGCGNRRGSSVDGGVDGSGIDTTGTTGQNETDRHCTDPITVMDPEADAQM